jgi:hypothetical protein
VGSHRDLVDQHCVAVLMLEEELRSGVVACKHHVVISDDLARQVRVVV